MCEHADIPGGGAQDTQGPPTSEILETLAANLPVGTVTLDDALAHLGDRSFGVVLLLLALLAILPGISALIGVLLLLPAVQMLLGRGALAFPAFVGARKFESRRLRRTILRVLPTLRWMERFVRPRWRLLADVGRRVAGLATVVLALGLLLPIPLSNVPTALVLALVALAYLERDGLLLGIAVTLGLALAGTAAVLAWEALSTTGWVGGLI